MVHKLNVRLCNYSLTVMINLYQDYIHGELVSEIDISEAFIVSSERARVLSG